MDRKDRQKEEEILNEFYLDEPEEKILYPIDYLWKFKEGSNLEMKDNWSVNLEDGKKKEIEIKEINFKKRRI
jgi:hypothetical protein